MKRLFVFIFLLLSGLCHAETWVHVSGLSIHQRQDLNGINLGIGIEHGLDNKWSVAVGTYNNSINNQSIYSLVKYKIVEYDSISSHLQFGVVTGYRISPVPVLLPEICFTYICAFVIPPISNTIVGTAGAYLRIPVN